VHNDKWSERFTDVARLVASWSKDPSTQVGAVIVDTKRRVIGLGYNGFPRGVADTPERYADREQKYPRVVHAEANAILNAIGSVEGCTLYGWPLPPCAECAKLIIQAGITRVVSRHLGSGTTEKWHESWAVACDMFLEAGVEVELR